MQGNFKLFGRKKTAKRIPYQKPIIENVYFIGNDLFKLHKQEDGQDFQETEPFLHEDYYKAKGEVK